MKKSIFPLLFAVVTALSLLPSCSKPGDGAGLSESVTVGYTASIEGLNDGTGSNAGPFWKSGDKIGILLDDGSVHPLPLVSGEGGAEARFEGKLPAGRTPDGKAVYPYIDGCYSFDGGVLSVDLPKETAHVSDDAVQAVMTAEAGGDNVLHFRHEGAVLRFSVMEIPSSAVRFRFESDGNVYGNDSYDITFSAGRASVFHVPVRAGECKGYTVSFSDVSGNVLASYTEAAPSTLSKGELCRVPGFRVEETDSFRLLVYNILNGMEYDYDNNFNKFVAWVSSIKPDVAVICESKAFNKSDDEKKNPAFFAARIKTTASRWGHGNVAIVNRDNYPVVVTSSLPLTEEKIVSNGKYVSHGAVYVSVSGYNLVGLHLRPTLTSVSGDKTPDEYYGELRLNEIRHIIAETKDAFPERRNWIFCGDFNMLSYKERNARSPLGGLKAKSYPDIGGKRNIAYDVYDTVCDSGLRDVLYEYNGGIYLPTMVTGRSRYDYIFATDDVYARVRRAEVIRGGFSGDYSSQGNAPSDHIPLLMELSRYEMKVIG